MSSTEPRYVNGFKVPENVNWSATSWKRWRTCPKWFYQANVIYTPVPVGRVATLAGSVVHEINEEAFKQKNFDVRFYLSLVESKFNEIIEKENIQFASQQERDEQFKKAIESTQKFYEALHTHDLFDYEAKLETPFNIPFAPHNFLKGKSDYIRRRPDHVQLLDFKNTVHANYLDPDQLSIYSFAEAVQQGIKLADIKASFLLIPLNKMIPVHLSISKVRSILTEMVNAYNQMQRGYYPASANSVSCKLCPYKDTCAEYQEFTKAKPSLFQDTPKFVSTPSLDILDF